MENMKSLPTTVDPYEREQQHNNQQVAQLMTALFPDIGLPLEDLYELLHYLNNTKVNASVLPKVIRGVHNISIGTGNGQVIVHVRKDVLNVSVREQDEEIKASRD